MVKKRIKNIQDKFTFPDIIIANQKLLQQQEIKW